VPHDLRHLVVDSLHGLEMTGSPETFEVPDSFQLAARHRRLGIDVSPDDNTPNERGNLRYVIDTLVGNWEIRRRVNTDGGGEESSARSVGLPAGTLPVSS
jgi:hypothetical protein